MSKVGEYEVFNKEANVTGNPAECCRVRIHELLRQRARQLHQQAADLDKLAEWLEQRIPSQMEEILWDIMHGIHSLGR